MGVIRIRVLSNNYNLDLLLPSCIQWPRTINQVGVFGWIDALSVYPEQRRDERCCGGDQGNKKPLTKLPSKNPRNSPDMRRDGFIQPNGDVREVDRDNIAVDGRAENDAVPNEVVVQVNTFFDGLSRPCCEQLAGPLSLALEPPSAVPRTVPVGDNAIPMPHAFVDRPDVSPLLQLVSDYPPPLLVQRVPFGVSEVVSRETERKESNVVLLPGCGESGSDGVIWAVEEESVIAFGISVDGAVNSGTSSLINAQIRVVLFRELSPSKQGKGKAKWLKKIART